MSVKPKKPRTCPFCGASGTLVTGTSFTVVCKLCDARGPLCPTEKAALESWNRRIGASEE